MWFIQPIQSMASPSYFSKQVASAFFNRWIPTNGACPDIVSLKGLCGQSLFDFWLNYIWSCGLVDGVHRLSARMNQFVIIDWSIHEPKWRFQLKSVGYGWLNLLWMVWALCEMTVTFDSSRITEWCRVYLFTIISETLTFSVRCLVHYYRLFVRLFHSWCSSCIEDAKIN